MDHMSEVAIKKISYNPSLDGLRFMAFFLVFIHHSKIESYFFINQFHEIGWLGVDLFLCLSAYLLTKLLVTEFDVTKSINFKSFYIRRILRIWPLYFTFITGCLFYSLVYSNEPLRTLMGRFLGLVTFSDNMISLIRGYSLVKWTGHLWTISLEEQFYFILPFFLFSLLIKNWRNKKQLFVYFISIELILIFTRLAIVTLLIDHPYIWTSPFRVDSVLFGVFLGLGMFDCLKINSLVSGFLGLLLLYSIAWIPGGVGSVGLNQVFIYSLVALGAMLMVYSCLEKNIISRMLSFRPISYLGKISYGLYVFHILTIDITQKYFENKSVGLLSIFAISLLLTIIVSALSYELFEKYFLKIKKKFEIIKSRPA